MPRKRKSDLAYVPRKARALRAARARESEEQKKARQKIDAERQAARRASEAPEQTEARRTLDAYRRAAYRASLTPEQAQARRALNAARRAAYRASLTPEQIRARRALDAARHASYRATGIRRHFQRQRVLNAERQLKTNPAFTVTSWQHQLLLLDRMDKKYGLYRALKKNEETAGEMEKDKEKKKIINIDLDDEDEDGVEEDDMNDSNSENSNVPSDNGSLQTKIKRNRKMTRALKSILANNSTKFMRNFDPELSNREKRKLSRKFNAEKKKAQAQDENGSQSGLEKDICDCSLVSCPGCHFPCPKCRSCKCGVECRINRKWTYEIVEVEGEPVVNRTMNATAVS